LFGLFEAEIIAFSLFEITTSVAFAIAFGVGFCLLAIALAWRIWISVPNGWARYTLLAFAVLVLAAGVSCFTLEAGWSKKLGYGGKIPLYSLIGISFAFTMTYIFSELANFAPWDRCCGTDHVANPIFGSSSQIFALFGTALGLGCIFGIMFGATNVITGDSSELLKNALYSIPIGLSVGALFGVGNEIYRQKQQDPESANIIHHQHTSDNL